MLSQQVPCQTSDRIKQNVRLSIPMHDFFQKLLGLFPPNTPSALVVSNVYIYCNLLFQNNMMPRMLICFTSTPGYIEQVCDPVQKENSSGLPRSYFLLSLIQTVKFKLKIHMVVKLGKTISVEV